jgi:uncharacterized protein
MYFAILCFDKPNLGELRERVRPEHLEYLKAHAAVMHIGGPIEDLNGSAIGAIFLIDVEDHDAAVSFMGDEPYHRRSLYEAVIVRRWHQVFPEIEPGANAGGARAAALQLKADGISPKQS